MRYRSVRRRRLTPRQKGIYARMRKAELRAGVLAHGIGEYFKHVCDLEDLENILECVPGLRSMLATQERLFNLLHPALRNPSPARSARKVKKDGK